MKKAYICSPYYSSTEWELDRNVEYAQKLTKRALKDGFAPITPHLYLTQCLNDKKSYERAIGLNASLALLECCDVMYVGLNYGLSEDMCKEIKKAQEMGIEIIKC